MKKLTASDFAEVVQGEGYYETANKYYGIQAPHNGANFVENPCYIIWLGDYAAATAETLQAAIDRINAEFLEEDGALVFPELAMYEVLNHTTGNSAEIEAESAEYAIEVYFMEPINNKSDKVTARLIEE